MRHRGIHSSPLLCAAVEGLVRDIRKLQVFAGGRPSEGTGGCRFVNPGKPVRPVDGVTTNSPDRSTISEIGTRQKDHSRVA